MSNWIKVSENPPDYSVPVLLFVVHPSWCGECIEGWRDLNGQMQDFYRLATGATAGPKYVEYWQPLPEPARRV